MSSIVFNSACGIAIKFKLPLTIERLAPGDEVTAILSYKKNVFGVCDKDESLHLAWYLKNKIDLTLDGKKKLDTNLFSETIKAKDLGYLNNKYIMWCSLGDSYKDDTFTSMHEGQGKSLYWPGDTYCLFFRLCTFSTWLYQIGEQFFIKVTPMYQFNRYETEEEDIVPFEEFMANYEPLLTVEIPRQTLEQWRDQANDLMEQILANEKKYNRWFTEDKEKSE